jgi:hypothetical protein
VEFRSTVHGYSESESFPKFNAGAKARDLRSRKDLIWVIDLIMRDQR